MKSLKCMVDIPYVDLDYCQFSTWGYQKPTRFWGGLHVLDVPTRVCKPEECPNVIGESGHRRHRERLGGNGVRFGRTKKYRIPEDLIRHISAFADPVVVRKVVRNLELMGWREPMRVGFEGVDSDDEIEDPIIDVAREIAKSDLAPHFVGSVVQASGAAQGPGVEIARQKILDEYKDSVFNT